MATSQQIMALISSHLDGDNGRFVAVARQIEAHEKSKGNTLADRISSVLSRKHRAPQMVSLSSSMEGLLSVVEPGAKLDDMVLAKNDMAHILRVLLENRSVELLEQHNLRPRRKILLCGPPGCGKTMTAHVLASELSLPLFLVRLEGVLKSYMGQTSENVGKIFEHVQTRKGVYLFDEFDALGTERDWSGREAAAGETRRVLNSLLLMLERDDSDSLIVAATNHEQILDRALFRRFDAIIQYPKPTADIRRVLIERVLGRTGLVVPTITETESSASDGLSQSEIESACLDAAKDAVLSGRMVERDDLIKNLQARRDAKDL